MMEYYSHCQQLLCPLYQGLRSRSLSVSLCVSLCVCLSVSVSVCVCLSLPLSLCVSIYQCLSLSLSLLMSGQLLSLSLAHFRLVCVSPLSLGYLLQRV